MTTKKEEEKPKAKRSKRVSRVSPSERKNREGFSDRWVGARIVSAKTGRKILNFMLFRDLFETEFMGAIDYLRKNERLKPVESEIVEMLGRMYDDFNLMFDRYESRMKIEHGLSEKIRRDIIETDLSDLAKQCSKRAEITRFLDNARKRDKVK